jgi:hypothetical protein
VLFDHSRELAIMLRANLMLEFVEIGIRIDAIAIDQLL